DVDGRATDVALEGFSTLIICVYQVYESICDLVGQWLIF
nr:hypothetical protein [Tanacetum cinerariifolium]